MSQVLLNGAYAKVVFEDKLCCLIMLHVFLIDQMRSTYQMITNTNL
jgi:hypothetical protein